MTGLLEQEQDITSQVVRRNLSRIHLVAIAAPLLQDPRCDERVTRLLAKFNEWRLPKPRVLVLAHSDAEHAAAQRYAAEIADYGPVQIVRQAKHGDAFPNALALYRETIDPKVDRSEAKRHIVLLARRGGTGQPEFIRPFTDGDTTTCGEWVPDVDHRPRARKRCGFISAAPTSGCCPVDCRFCFLRAAFNDGMALYLNWESLAAELARDWRDYPFPLNFGDRGGLIEYDEWFGDKDGHGSLAQFVIDACAAANVAPNFLTKVRFPEYLVFRGRVQACVSAMPEAIRRDMAPGGSPTDELLQSLAWAVSAGAVDPVVRMFTLWQHEALYLPLLVACRDLLGRSDWRLTLDVCERPRKPCLTDRLG